LINSKPRAVAEGSGSNINIITRRGVKTGADVESPHQIMIQKNMPNNSKYDLTRHKELFKNAVEMFRHLPSPSILEVVETSFKLIPHQPRIARESSTQMESSGKSQKVVDLWFQLFSDILDDEQLIENL
jgi:hypothetical protein